ncbi:DNA-binding protein [Nitrospira sp. KM1]|uniref:helix-turn-helix domain-containing protein n=1 Tax=Nitrospira sp. KM1 TaxID=1936990 RepID=UPI0013A769C8|nr:helix-turn-helix domain-containing protein [Nitrospira sp. KM1]BCA54399.1 DNA-binding protein [Nitrospira sp. KM1]
MESIGEFFRQVRETKGLTIEEVASKTRIRSDFVKALEEGNFAKLPDQVFARGFVRSYARSLGLDEEDAIHRFTQSAGAFYEKQDERERLKVRQVQEERKRQANRKAVAIAIGIAILTLIFLLSREQTSLLVHRSGTDTPTPSSKRPAPVSANRDSQPDAPPRQEQEASVASTKPKAPDTHAPILPVKPETTSARVQAPIPTSPPAINPSVPPTPPPIGGDGPLGGLSLEGPAVETADQLVLDLEATELSWIVIQVDGGNPQEALLRPGEKAKWKGQEQFLLTLGNAGGVKAELNGKPQRSFGPSGKVARDIVLKR